MHFVYFVVCLPSRMKDIAEQQVTITSNGMIIITSVICLDNVECVRF